ncbi:MAG: Holliday junction branch migration protein RuvA [Dehalococcoidia bacterium]|nr:Holliday junction branch migration protein RuvA [Dehalococcoidia bacterium]
MITSVTGALEAVRGDGVVVRVGGVGLYVQVPTAALETLGAPGDRVHLYTHLQVGEDTLHLYGFPTEAALRMFELLLGVGGIGPRSALSILSTLAPEEVAGAIISEDTNTLSRAPGVGKRSASRIILELKDKVEREGLAVAPGSTTPTDGQVVEALTALGYSELEARRALRALGVAQGLDLEERVRRALQNLGAAER